MGTFFKLYRSETPPAIRGAVPLDEPIASATAPAAHENASLFLQALDILNEGLILTDGRSRFLYSNRAARAILSSGALAIRNDLLCARTAGETRDLRDIIETQARNPVSSAYLRLGEPCTRGSILLTVTAAPATQADRLSDRASVVILVKQLSRAELPSHRMISTFFGLTPAEARLAREMAKGDGVGPCASRLGITANTARTHLNHIFEKTGTRRQAELVRLLVTCGMSVGERRLAAVDTTPTRRA